MTDAETINLIADLESVQGEMLAEERRLDAQAVSAGGCEEFEYGRWIELRGRGERIREQLLEVIEAEPEGVLDSPAFMALEMSDLRMELVELDWEMRNLEENDLRAAIARGLKAGCEERIAELKAKLDLLGAGGSTAAISVVPAGSATLLTENSVNVEAAI